MRNALLAVICMLDRFFYTKARRAKLFGTSTLAMDSDMETRGGPSQITVLSFAVDTDMLFRLMQP